MQHSGAVAQRHRASSGAQRRLALATHFYQAAREGERRLRTVFHGVISADDLLADAAQETDAARAAMESAHRDYEFARLTATLAHADEPLLWDGDQA